MDDGSVAYIDELQAWRAQMDAALRADDGWLTLAGLFWLAEGASTFGSGTGCDVVLHDGCPAVLGTFHRRGEVVSVEFAPGVRAEINGRPAEGRVELRGDGGGPEVPDLMAHASLRFHVLVRGPRVGIRLRDLDSDVRRVFGGRRWFAPDPAARVVARFEAFPPGTTIPITNVLGDTEPTPSPGRAHFELAGQAYSLDAVASGDQLLFNFKDGTNGATSYGAGRFLFVAPPDADSVVLDFNRAVSPPCAFTVHATCPLAPRQNHLPRAIEAGETVVGGGH